MSAATEFYVVASEGMRPVEAIGPLKDREVALKIVTVFRLVKSRVPFTIATRRPAGIPIMPAAMFVAEFEAAMKRARLRTGAQP